MFTWHYCRDRQDLPELNKGKLCLFWINGRVSYEVCVLVEDIFQPGVTFWVIKGSTEIKAVHPYAWLEVSKELGDSFFTDLALLKQINFARAE